MRQVHIQTQKAVIRITRARNKCGKISKPPNQIPKILYGNRCCCSTSVHGMDDIIFNNRKLTVIQTDSRPTLCVFQVGNALHPRSTLSGVTLQFANVIFIYALSLFRSLYCTFPSTPCPEWLQGSKCIDQFNTRN